MKVILHRLQHVAMEEEWVGVPRSNTSLCHLRLHSTFPPPKRLKGAGCTPLAACDVTNHPARYSLQRTVYGVRTSKDRSNKLASPPSRWALLAITHYQHPSHAVCSTATTHASSVLYRYPVLQHVTRFLRLALVENTKCQQCNGQVLGKAWLSCCTRTQAFMGGHRECQNLRCVKWQYPSSCASDIPITANASVLYL